MDRQSGPVQMESSPPIMQGLQHIATEPPAWAKTAGNVIHSGMLFSGSPVFFFRGKCLCSSLQLIGAACLVVVVFTHVCEALHLFPLDALGLGA